MELKINWNHRRCKHAIERMWLRGVSADEVKDAIIKGNKVKQNSGLIEAFFRFFSVVYDEQIVMNKEIRKIFPVTLKLW